MVYISLLAFRSRGKGHLAYYMRLLHGDSLALFFQLPPRRSWNGLYNNPYNAWGLSIDAQTIQLQCNRHGLRGLEGLLSEVADSYKQLAFGPLFL